MHNFPIEELLELPDGIGVRSIELDEGKEEITLFLSTDNLVIPKEYTIHSYKTRKLRHLNLFQYTCFLVVDIPLLKHKATGKTRLADLGFTVPGSGFTLRFEQQVVDLVQIHYCKAAVAKQLSIYPQVVERIFNNWVQSGSNLTQEPGTVRH